MQLNRQRGFSMVEMMLVILIMTGVMAFMVERQSSMTNDIKANVVADNMNQVLTGAQAYVNANWSSLVSATTDGTGAANYCKVNTAADGSGGEQLNDAAKHTCMFDVNWLIFKGFLPAGARTTNALGQQWVAIAKQVYDASSAPTGNLELLLVGATTVGTASVNPVARVSEESLERAVAATGAVAGIVPDQSTHPCGWGNTDATKFICGAQGAWKVKLSDFMN